jgi:5-methylcytosine-specific restriction endonuclease McrA
MRQIIGYVREYPLGAALLAGLALWVLLILRGIPDLIRGQRELRELFESPEMQRTRAELESCRDRRPAEAQEWYRGYLQSPWWKRRRLDKLDTAGHSCEKCGAQEPLEVHHLSYDRLGAELMSDLMVLCDQCHYAAHGR